jgi:uncharacterized protein (DUF433 family)
VTSGVATDKDAKKVALLRQDPRDLASYTLTEAGLYLRLPVSTIRAWAFGQEYRTSGGVMKPAGLFRIARATPPTLSFWNLVEVYLLVSIRRFHRVPMQKVRPALRYLEREFELARPLLQKQVLTDGVSLFVEHLSHLINISREGQVVLRELIEGSLKRIDRDLEGFPVRMSPWRRDYREAREVEIDPHRAFGRMVIASTGIPTEIIAERFEAGESIDALATDYRIQPAQIEAALRWQQHLHAA